LLGLSLLAKHQNWARRILARLQRIRRHKGSAE
jgi:hypothetical protein